MRTVVRFAVSVALISICTPLVVADAQSPAAATTTQPSSAPRDELHFVSVLTLQGEVLSVDPQNRLVTVRGPNGATSTLETRREEDVQSLKVGEHITVRYFEGAQIVKYSEKEKVPTFSLKHGIAAAKLGGPSGKRLPPSRRLGQSTRLNRRSPSRDRMAVSKR
jgi:hypothetical protein